MIWSKKVKKKLKKCHQIIFFSGKNKKQRVVFSLFPFFDKKTKKNAFFKMRKKISAVLNSSKKIFAPKPPLPPSLTPPPFTGTPIKGVSNCKNESLKKGLQNKRKVAKRALNYFPFWLKSVLKLHKLSKISRKVWSIEQDNLSKYFSKILILCMALVVEYSFICLLHSAKTQCKNFEK